MMALVLMATASCRIQRSGLSLANVLSSSGQILYSFGHDSEVDVGTESATAAGR